MNNKSSTSTNKNKGKQKPKTQANRRRRVRKNQANRSAKSQALAPGANISQCTKHYVRALTNPFNPFKDLPCIPDQLVNPSHKYNTWTRGTFSTGTQGVGWVVVNPWYNVYNDGAFAGTSSSNAIISTTPAFAGANYNWTVVAGIPTVGVVGANSNSRFTQNDFINNRWNYRIVGCGIRVKYTGTTFRNQGRLIMYRQQANDPIPLGSDASVLFQDNYTSTIPVNRSKETVVTYQTAEYDFTSYQEIGFYLPLIPINNTQQRWHMLIYVDGGDTTTPQSFEYEVATFFEIVGRGLPLTSSHSDVVGMGQAIASLPNKIPLSPPSIVERSVLQQIGQSLYNSVSYAAPRLISAGMNSFLSSYSNPLALANMPTITEID
jgi:hypothetical protein